MESWIGRHVCEGLAMQNAQQKIVRQYIDSGVCVLPIRLDGTKAPDLRQGHEFFNRMPTDDELRQWCSKPCGWGIVGGKVSFGVEIIDFDAGELFYAWRYVAGVELVSRLPVVKTPSNGWHIYYRCREICGNKVLAYDHASQVLDTADNYIETKPGLWQSKQKPGAKLPPVDCLIAPITGNRNKRARIKRIETRGQGGFVVCPLSPASVHRRNVPYTQVSGPPLPEIPEITPDERRRLWNAAGEFCTIGEDYTVKLTHRLVSEYRNKQAAELVRHVDDETKLRRASAYLSKMEPAVSGANGHAATFKAACTILNGFALSPDQTLEILKTEFNPRCSPPWGERELVHKVNEAAKQGGPRGYLLAGSRN